jgi:hypothetical protein
MSVNGACDDPRQHAERLRTRRPCAFRRTKAVAVRLNNGDTGMLAGENVIVNAGTRASIR